MSRLLLLGVLVVGLAGFAVGQNNQGGNNNDQGGNNQGGSRTVPEPSQAISALGLLAGSTLILRGLRKK